MFREGHLGSYFTAQQYKMTKTLTDVTLNQSSICFKILCEIIFFLFNLYSFPPHTKRIPHFIPKYLKC